MFDEPQPGGAPARAPRIALIDNWRQVLRRAWSVRLIVFAMALSGLEVAVQVLIAFEVRLPIGAGLFAALAGLVSAAAFAARFIAQKQEPEP